MISISISQLTPAGAFVSNVYCDGVNFFSELSRDTEIQCSQELEREAFQRVIGDVKLNLSNANSLLTNMFSLGNGQSRWRVIITSNSTQVFKGEIDLESVEFDAFNRWCSFDVYSEMKLFWDRTKKIYIDTEQSISPSSDYVSVYDIFANEFITRGLYTDIINSISISSDLINRQIRGWNVTSDASISNKGMFKNLSPETTHHDLFSAMCLYYNAEIYLLNGVLYFQKRNTTINSTPKSIVPLQSGSVLNLVDGEKHNYIYSTLNKITMPTPLFAGLTTSTSLSSGVFSVSLDYKITSVINGFETSGSETLNVTQVTDLRTYVITSVSLLLKPLATSLTVSERRVYRRGTDGKFHKIATILNNDEVVYADTSFLVAGTIETFPTLPDNSIYGGLWFWIKYDEASGSWQNPIFDVPNEDNRRLISGKVFEINVNLNFLENGSSNSSQLSGEWFYFFGQELIGLTFFNQWLDIFLQKKKIKCSTVGTDFCYGDTINITSNASQLPLGNWFAKRVVNKLISDTTEFELLQ